MNGDNAVIRPDEALGLLHIWAVTVHATDAPLDPILAGRAGFVGSVLLQYDARLSLLIARGVVFSDTSTLVNPQDTFRRLVGYARRHPETLEGAGLELAAGKSTDGGDGRIVLRSDFAAPLPGEDFVRALQVLSRNADIWRRKYVEKAMLGID
ncbi:hypothetical protein CRT60_19105 [Azospirillum palustre]|uniref:Uncharacterized protein n=1 Tax=Azospirillum palustre TaxID=2044885 RepID=A0A2B8BD04_9PROT|nr:hypothetical protein CRT60_19105 [Azospirillum palustre]